ncbi:MAG: lambda exonuclease family protein [Paraburkholderia sp.]|uniref:lambda exonuclease family protein n=1 Tax=Paraburkholderia sp. TaxID=1926495 RepID=UPI003C5A46D0
MFKIARSKINGLDEKQAAYVNAILSGLDEAAARDVADYKAPPKSETVKRAIAGEVVGDPSEAALNYAFRLAVERISGQPLDEGFETWQMRRGHDLEPAARLAHEASAGVMVERAGFVTTDDGRFGASADGLIGDDGGSEYKCLVSPEGLRDVLLSDDISEFIDQIQGCMWITGRRYWHFALYCPALEPVGKELYWRRVERDEGYIEDLEIELLQFSALVDQYERTLRQKAA